jgi:hypothetical protein
MTKKSYLCYGTKLKDDDGKLHLDGSVIELSDELAAHYSAHNVLRPYFPPAKEAAPKAETKVVKEPVNAEPNAAPSPKITGKAL